MAEIIFIDNHDSFTYNLVDELKMLGHNITVYRNTVGPDVVTKRIDMLLQQNIQTVLFLSPGPGKPSDVKLMTFLLERYKALIPIIGICLGHQAISEFYGGKVGLAEQTIHGKSSKITVEDHPIFNGLPKPLTVARYHSLAATYLPDELQVIGVYQNTPMAIINEQDKVLGFQFHPESVLTTDGTTLLQQSINYLLKSDQ